MKTYFFREPVLFHQPRNTDIQWQRNRTLGSPRTIANTIIAWTKNSENKHNQSCYLLSMQEHRLESHKILGRKKHQRSNCFASMLTASRREWLNGSNQKTHQQAKMQDEVELKQKIWWWRLRVNPKQRILSKNTELEVWLFMTRSRKPYEQTHKTSAAL